MEDILPEAVRCGISYKEFWHLTPAAVYMIEEAYYEKLKHEIDMVEQSAWMNGQYVLAAIGVAFSKKKREYPKNPVQERELHKEVYTEEEKEMYVGMLFGQLETMQKNFEMNHENNWDKSVS